MTEIIDSTKSTAMTGPALTNRVQHRSCRARQVGGPGAEVALRGRSDEPLAGARNSHKNFFMPRAAATINTTLAFAAQPESQSRTNASVLAAERKCGRVELRDRARRNCAAHTRYNANHPANRALRRARPSLSPNSSIGRSIIECWRRYGSRFTTTKMMLSPARVSFCRKTESRHCPRVEMQVVVNLQGAILRRILFRRAIKSLMFPGPSQSRSLN